MGMESHVKKIRLSLGLSQKEFGLILGVSRTMIYNYESGEKAPNNTRIKQLLGIAKEQGLLCKAEDFFKPDKLSTNSVGKAGDKLND